MLRLSLLALLLAAGCSTGPTKRINLPVSDVEYAFTAQGTGLPESALFITKQRVGGRMGGGSL